MHVKFAESLIFICHVKGTGISDGHIYGQYMITPSVIGVIGVA